MRQRGDTPSITRAQKRHLRERDALRKRFGAAYDALNEVLEKYDPVGIAGYGEPNEYDLEVHTILGRVDEFDSEDALRRVIVEEFDRWFAPMETDIRKCAAGIAAAFWPQIRAYARNRGPAGA